MSARRRAAGSILLVALFRASPGLAQATPGQTPVAATPVSPLVLDAQVPVNDAKLRTLLGAAPSVSSWTAQFGQSGAVIDAVTPLVASQPPARLQITLAFDVSASFKQWLGLSTELATRFIDESMRTGLDVRFSVHAFGTSDRSLGDAVTSDEAKAHVREVSQLAADQRTNLRALMKAQVEQLGQLVRFPSGVRELVVFTDAGEESKALPLGDYSEVASTARGLGVIVHGVVFQPARARNGATQTDRLATACESTGGYLVRANPNAVPQALADVTAAAALPATLYDVRVSPCGLKPQSGGAYYDSLRFTLSLPGEPPWSSSTVMLTLPQPDQAPACPPTVAAPVPPALGTSAPSGNPALAGSGTLAAPVDEARDWPWYVVAAALGALGLIGALAWRRRSKPNVVRPAPAPAPSPAAAVIPPPPPRLRSERPLPERDPSVPPLATPEVPVAPHHSPPPLVVLPQISAREPRAPDPLARRRVTELFVIACPVPITSPIRITTEVPIWRAPSMELVLDVPVVGNHHATVSVGSDGELYVVDQGSVNGTFVDGVRIPPHQRHRVPNGAELAFTQQVRFRVSQAKSGAPHARSVLPPGHGGRGPMTAFDGGGSKGQS